MTNRPFLWLINVASLPNKCLRHSKFDDWEHFLNRWQGSNGSYQVVKFLTGYGDRVAAHRAMGRPYCTTSAGAAGHKLRNETGPKRSTCLGAKQSKLQRTKKDDKLVTKEITVPIDRQWHLCGLEVRLVKGGYLYRMPTDESDNWLWLALIIPA